ncbi:hypothetical protein [Rivibacter subsaxonicus]|uniref:RloB-like protein n=1 Tax=Rivibacter subsaxonicus TaxID=457575 RepID=A0A4Q7VEX2_9BURK|nr:hypothetical protein [Rivibacter subsaxonicus]RZT93728.1 hypothetical protein EV670_3281 [Rivibacter subsaxonicus]
MRLLSICAAVAIGEGKGEYEFVCHTKSLYLPRACGTTLKVKQAFGKGGRGVLDYAIQVKKANDFDRCIAVLDTDTDWDDRQRKRARLADILVVESTPCLEAWLLQIHEVGGVRSSTGHKEEFERRFGAPAHDAGVYGRHFPRAVLDAARHRVGPLRELLASLNVP